MSSTISVVSLITIIGGISIFVFGTFGNICNIKLFLKNHRNSCAYIFIVSSIVNIFVLFVGLLTRILSVGFSFDWSNTNVIWCKIRICLTQTSFLISLTCYCLASIDRFLISSRKDKLRKLSQLRLTKLTLILIIIFWICHSIPYLIYGQLLRSSSTGLLICSLIPNESYSIYRIYIVLPIYLGLFPTLILTITGLLTYKNMKEINRDNQRKSLQRQLTRMMLIEIPIILISLLPYIIYSEYSSITSTYIKSTNQRYIESILTNLANLMFYITFASPFYVFYFSSKSFRQDFQCLIFCRTNSNNNQIQIQTISPSRV